MPLALEWDAEAGDTEVDSKKVGLKKQGSTL